MDKSQLLEYALEVHDISLDGLRVNLDEGMQLIDDSLALITPMLNYSIITSEDKKIIQFEISKLTLLASVLQETTENFSTRIAKLVSGVDGYLKSIEKLD